MITVARCAVLSCAHVATPVHGDLRQGHRGAL